MLVARSSAETLDWLYRSAQDFTIDPQRLQSSLQFLHHTSVDPQTSQTSGSGSRAEFIQ